MPNDDDLPPLDDETQAAIDSLGIDPEPNGAPPVPTEPVQRFRGKDRRPRRRGAVAAVPEASPPPVVSSPAVVAGPVNDGTKDALAVWPRILAEETARGYAPGAIGIKITRTPMGPARGTAVQMAPIDGALVAGSGNPDGSGVGPGEELYFHIRDYYHMAWGAGAGPARYDLNFYYRAGGGNIKGTAEIVLDHPDVIRRQIAAEEEMRRAKMGGGGYSGFPAYPGPQHYRLTPMPMPPVPGGPPQQPTQSYTARDMEQVQELAGSNGYLRGLLEMHQKQAAQPAAPAPPVHDPRSPPPGLTAQEWEEIQTKRMAAAVGPAVVQALVAMGFTPNTSQPAVAPVAPASTPDPIDVVDAALKMIQKFTGAQQRITEAMGAAASAAPGAETTEDPYAMKPVLGGEAVAGIGPMAYGPKLEDESVFDYAVRWGTHNPGAIQRVMAYVGGKLSPESIQKLVETIAARKKAPPQAPAAPAAPQMGWQPSGSST